MNEPETTNQFIQLAREFGPYGVPVATLVVGYILPYVREYLTLSLEHLRETIKLNQSRRILNETDTELTRAALASHEAGGTSPGSGSVRSIRTSRHDASPTLPIEKE